MASSELVVKLDQNEIKVTEQAIDFLFGVIDKGSGFNSANVLFVGPNGKTSYGYFNQYNEVEGTSDVYKLSVSAGSLNYIKGAWKIQSIELWDKAQNKSIYSADWFITKGIQTNFYNAIGEESAPDYWKASNSNGSYSGDQANPFTGPAIISSLSFAESLVDLDSGSKTVELIVSGKNISSATNLGINFQTESLDWLQGSNLQYVETLSGDSNFGTFKYKYEINQYNSAGQYYIDSVNVSNYGFFGGKSKSAQVNYVKDPSNYGLPSNDQYWTYYSDKLSLIAGSNQQLIVKSSKKDYYKPELESLSAKIVKASALGPEFAAKFNSLLNESSQQNDFNSYFVPLESLQLLQVDIECSDDSSGLANFNLTIQNQKSGAKIYLSDYTSIKSYSDLTPSSFGWLGSGSGANAGSPIIWQTGNDLNKKTTFYVAFNKYAADGLWSIEELNFSDKSGKINSFNAEKLEIEGFLTSAYLDNPFADTQPPELNLVAVKNMVNEYSITSKGFSATSKLLVSAWFKGYNNYDDSEWSTKGGWEAFSLEKKTAYDAIDWSKADLKNFTQSSTDNLDWGLVDFAELTKNSQAFKGFDWGLVQWWTVGQKQFDAVSWSVGTINSLLAKSYVKADLLFNSAYYKSMSLSQKKSFYSKINWDKIGFWDSYNKTYANIDWGLVRFDKVPVWQFADGLNLNKIQFAEFGPASYAKFKWDVLPLAKLNAKTIDSINWDKVNYNKLLSYDSKLLAWKKQFPYNNFTTPVAADFAKIQFDELSQATLKKLESSLRKYDQSIASLSYISAAKSGFYATKSSVFDVVSVSGQATKSLQLDTDPGAGDLILLASVTANLTIKGFKVGKDQLVFKGIKPSQAISLSKSTVVPDSTVLNLAGKELALLEGVKLAQVQSKLVAGKGIFL